MKRIKYKTLMKKVADGYAEIDAWQGTGSHALVRFYKNNGTSTRETVEVLGVPENLER